MKKILSLAVALVLLMSLCACGEEGPTKPIALRYNGEIISVYSTQTQLTVKLGEPTRTEHPIVNSSRTDCYYLGGTDRFMFNDSGLYSILITDTKFDFGGLKIGDSYSKAQKYLDIKSTDNGTYTCCVVKGEVHPAGYMESHGTGEEECQKVVIQFENDMIKSIELTRMVDKVKVG